MICEDAQRMIYLRRQFAADSQLSDSVKKALMDCIDLVRWNHEGESPRCGCWQKARRTAGSPFNTEA